MRLSKNTLGIILNRLDYKSAERLILLLVKTKYIDKFTNNIWRLLFFKKIQYSSGSWFNACKSITNFGDTYQIRCYQCGTQIVRLPFRPTLCPLCNMGLCVKDTWISTYV